MVDKKILEEEVQKLINIDHIYNEMDEEKLLESLNRLKASIPEKRKASYGIVSVIAVYCKTLFNEKADSYDLAIRIYESSIDFKSVCIGLGILSHIGVKEPLKILPILEEASNHELWEVKEFVQMFIRKITKENKKLVQDYLLELTQSTNSSIRRFSSEALRPVVENKWIQDEPEFSLKVLRKLFKESEDFPKVSVGNNLSDLSRKNPELIMAVVKELKSMNNENSNFIAYRACRNLIKMYPVEVMDLLEIESYKYKKNTYHKSDYIKK